MNTLTGMYFSPWTERARWALDHHDVPYDYREYTTLIGEPMLRLRAGKWFSKVSVPLLTTPGGLVHDSFEIARWADRHSPDAPLVQAAHLQETQDWLHRAELALCSARLRATRRISHSVDALAERLPGYTPDALRKPLAPMAFIATQYILGKYRLPGSDEMVQFRLMDEFFGTASAALHGRDFVFNQFSFVDIVIATALQALTPVDDRYIYLGPGSRVCMCEPELAEKYANLIAWRDEIYARFR